MQTQIRPLLQTVTLRDFAYLAIEKHFKKSIKHESEVLADQDPEPLHQMRVGLRRLRTVMQVFDFAIKLPKDVGIPRIRQFAQVLGAVRDLDVLEAELEAQAAGLPQSEQDVLKPVFKAMKKERDRAFKKLKKTLKSKAYKKFKQGFEDWLTRPQCDAIAQLPIQDVLPDLLLPLVSEMFLHPAWIVGVELEPGQKQMPVQTAEERRKLLRHHSLTLHDLRKQMKRVRYQTELFVDQYDEAYEAQVEEFKRIQEVLGDIQDSAVMHEYLDAHLKKPVDELCPQLSQALGEKVGQAWQEWRSLQAKYLNTQFRIELRQRILRFQQV